MAHEDKEMRALMALPEGRAFVHRLLQTAGVFRPSFAGDPYHTAFNEGQRNLGLWALNRLLPDEYAQMMKEHDDGPGRNRRREPAA